MHKVMVFNNTSRYHNGCIKVMQYLHTNLQENGYKILESVYGNVDKISFKESNFKNSDVVLVNGEGTMHHDSRSSRQLLEILRRAKREGKKTLLINTVFQAMTLDEELIKVLKDTYISVREVKSQRYLKNKFDIDSEVHLDLSYFMDVPDSVTPHRQYVTGKMFSRQDYKSRGVLSINIFKDSWNDIVNILRSTDLFITGRHHEMYASCKARCPFVVLSGNTWKNEGLFETAGVNIPHLPDRALDDEIVSLAEQIEQDPKEFFKLFNWMEQQAKWTIEGKI